MAFKKKIEQLLQKTLFFKEEKNYLNTIHDFVGFSFYIYSRQVLEADNRQDSKKGSRLKPLEIITGWNCLFKLVLLPLAPLRALGDECPQFRLVAVTCLIRNQAQIYENFYCFRYVFDICHSFLVPFLDSVSRTYFLVSHS